VGEGEKVVRSPVGSMVEPLLNEFATCSASRDTSAGKNSLRFSWTIILNTAKKHWA